MGTATPPTTLTFEPIGRLLQEGWLADVATGGPLRFADWLAGLPDGLAPEPVATWRIDLLVAAEVRRSGAAEVIVEPGGRCLSAVTIRVLETALAELAPRDIVVESVSLLGPAVAELADSEDWPVPAALRSRLESLAGRLGEALAATGARVDELDRLLAVPHANAGAESDGLDLDRAAAACLAVPRAVLASTPVEGAAR